MSDNIVPLLSFINDDILKYLFIKKRSIFYDENNAIRIVPDLNDLNRKIDIYLKNANIPESLLFVYDKDDDYNNEYIYLKEVFTGVSIKVDKVLVSVCKINKLEANMKLLEYNLKQIYNITNLLFNIQNEYKSSKIIEFANKRIKEK